MFRTLDYFCDSKESMVLLLQLQTAFLLLLEGQNKTKQKKPLTAFTGRVLGCWPQPREGCFSHLQFQYFKDKWGL